MYAWWKNLAPRPYHPAGLHAVLATAMHRFDSHTLPNFTPLQFLAQVTSDCSNLAAHSSA